MGQTKEGAQKAKKIMLDKYGEDYYSQIGAKGGKAQVFKGFAIMDKEKVSKAGRLGGSISRKNGSLPEAERERIRKTHISILDSDVPLIELNYIEDDSITIDLERKSHWWNRRKI